MNIYSEVLKDNLQKLLTLYDLDSSSSTYGCGDRLFWGWKTKDFANGTMQGGIHSLAIAIKLGLIENEEFALKVIDGAIQAIREIRARNGSMAEAYPCENSFCVTALVAFDVLSAVKYLVDRINEVQKKEYLEIIGPLIRFITCNSEVHAIISNHLATGAAAVVLWNKLSNDNNKRYQELLNTIYRYQSEEGWYREYEGADPGYQTLCTNYLAPLYDETQDEKLKDSLVKSAKFLKHFIHPDHTIGGLYGSRNTEVYYPGGIVTLSNICDDFGLVAKELERGIREQRHVLPQSIDIGNFIPLLNSYAFAGLEYEKNRDYIESVKKKPLYDSEREVDFKDSGIFIKSTKKYFAIINYKKGGTVKVFDKAKNMLDIEDGGLVGSLKNGIKFSTQQFDNTARFDNHIVRSNFYKIEESNPNPKNFIMLKIMALTIFKSVFLENFFKRYIIKRFITGKNKIDGKVLRKFDFSDGKILIIEDVERPKKAENVNHAGKTTPIHMASSGYYLKQIEEMPSNSMVVEFK